MAYLKHLLVSVSTTGPGTPFMFDQARAFNDFSLQGTFTGATDVEVDLEISLNGTDWAKLAPWGPGRPSGDVMDASRLIPCIGIRANVKTITGASSPSIDFWFAAAHLE